MLFYLAIGLIHYVKCIFQYSSEELKDDKQCPIKLMALATDDHSSKAAGSISESNLTGQNLY